MAIVRSLGKPSLFVTVTCNPAWDEITRALLPGQRPEDRPDVLARVFYLKLQSLLRDLTKSGVFGNVIGYMSVIEFQKRGKISMQHAFCNRRHQGAGSHKGGSRGANGAMPPPPKMVKGEVGWICPWDHNTYT